jgi:DtxR family Mn-dependent transcriptional regulator
MEISSTEENYLKAIYAIQHSGDKQGVSTSSLSEHLNNKAASVTDMLKRLSDKKLIHYKKYKAVSLTKQGEKMAIGIVRKHRLWEVFLMEKLNFGWDEVHDIAEQLEHIKSDELIERLDVFLNLPKYDPHGDPIPNAKGVLPKPKTSTLSKIQTKGLYFFVGVNDHHTDFLRHLTSIGLKIGDQIKIEEHNSYDGSYMIRINKKQSQYISHKVASNLLIELKS